MAIKSMGLDELAPFKPQEKIIEYMLVNKTGCKLADSSLNDFANETGSESPAPGGGSVAAYIGALCVSLATMAANLSAHKKVWEPGWIEFGDWAEKGQQYKNELLKLVVADIKAFNQEIYALALPKSSEEEKSLRTKAIEDATKYAIEIPFKVMQTAHTNLHVIKAMGQTCNPNSISYAGVGALYACSAVMGAFMNVHINPAGHHDKIFVEDIMVKGAAIQKETNELETEILKLVD